MLFRKNEKTFFVASETSDAIISHSKMVMMENILENGYKPKNKESLVSFDGVNNKVNMF